MDNQLIIPEEITPQSVYEMCEPIPELGMQEEYAKCLLYTLGYTGNIKMGFEEIYNIACASLDDRIKAAKLLNAMIEQG